MTDHAANLARVQALRDSLPPDPHVHTAAALNLVEDVLTRHAPEEAYQMERWPCPDYTSALRLLDALDGGRDG